jgi:hypothetical protein
VIRGIYAARSRLCGLEDVNYILWRSRRGARDAYLSRLFKIAASLILFGNQGEEDIVEEEVGRDWSAETMNGPQISVRYMCLMAS